MPLPFTGGSEAQREDEVTGQGCGNAQPGAYKRVQDSHQTMPPGSTKLAARLGCGGQPSRAVLALALPATLVR